MHTELTDLLLGTLLGRQTNSFQAFIIVLRKELLVEAQVLLRYLAESMFVIGAIGKGANFSEEYVRAKLRGERA